MAAPYRPDIDGLRAVAVCAVLLFHATGFGGGFVGVDVFFVISGFLIIGIVEREIGTSGFKPMHFYERRVRRLFPAFFVVALASAIVSLLIMMPSDLAPFGRSLVAATTFLSNFEFWRESGYFNTQSALKPLLHTWSLAVEEQFYLALPLFLIVTHRLVRRSAWIAIFAALIISFVASIWFTAHMSSVSFYLPFGRAWELLLGGALLFIPAHRRWAGLSTLGLALIAASVALYTAATPFPGLAALLPCLGSAAVLYGNGKGLGARLLVMRPIVYIGRISYPLYLWHWPILALGRYWFGELNLVGTAVGIGLSFSMAVLTYHFVERPIRSRRILRSRRSLFAVALAGSLALIAGGLGLALSHGAPWRIPAKALRLDAAESDRESLQCHNRSPADVDARRLCVIGAKVRPTMVVWGDSEGWAVQSVLAKALAAQNLSAYVATRDGCIPAVGVLRLHYDRKCEPFATAVQGLALSIHAKAVLILGLWGGYESNVMRFRGAKGWEASGAGLSDSVLELNRAGIHVILFDQPPGSRLSAPRSLAQQLTFHRDMHLTYSTAEYLGRPYFATARTLPVIRVKAWRTTCGAVCAVERSGRPLYFDGTHPAKSNTGFLEPYIESALRSISSSPVGKSVPNAE